MLFKMAANPSKQSDKAKPSLVRALAARVVDDDLMAVRIVKGEYDIASPNAKGESALHLASERGFLRCTKALLDAGMDPSAKDWRHSTPLLRAISGAGSVVLVEMLIGHGTNLNPTSKTINSPLDQAVASKRLDIALIMLRAGADPHRLDAAGTVLHTAVGTKDVDICREVLKWGVELEAENLIGETALSMSVMVGNPQIVRELVSAVQTHFVRADVE